MKAMILAAGRGERMMPLTATTPKPLLKVGQKPLLQYHIEALKNAGVEEIVINISHLGEQIEDYFGDGKALGVKIHWSREDMPLETAGGIKQALPLLGDSPFCLVNGDVWCDLAFEKLLTSPHIEPLAHGKALAHLVLVETPSFKTQGDFGLVNGKVVNQADKLWTYSGIALLSPNLLEATESGQVQALAPLLRQAAENDRVSGEIFLGDWRDIGTPERLEQLRQVNQ